MARAFQASHTSGLTPTYIGKYVWIIVLLPFAIRWQNNKHERKPEDETIRVHYLRASARFITSGTVWVYTKKCMPALRSFRSRPTNKSS